jgi:hypothetical protein
MIFMEMRLVPSPDALARELNGEVLILDLRSSQYFGLTGTGARVWQLIEEGRTPASAAAALAEEFAGDPEAIADDVRGFVAQLVERGLLVTA